MEMKDDFTNSSAFYGKRDTTTTVKYSLLLGVKVNSSFFALGRKREYLRQCLTSLNPV